MLPVHPADVRQPIPTRTSANRERFPFKTMEKGEHVEVPNLDKDPPPELKALAVTLKNARAHCFNQTKKSNGKQFMARLKPGNDYWIEIWRVE